jgi:hypothetical protein
MLISTNGGLMKLMDDEKVVIETDRNLLVLTTHRLRYDAESIGSGELASIMLEQVASCSLLRKTRPLYMAVAVLFLLSSLYLLNKGGNTYIPPLVIAVIFILLYYMSARKVLEISSSGGKAIYANVGGMDKERIVELIDTIESSKAKRLELVMGASVGSK